MGLFDQNAAVVGTGTKAEAQAPVAAKAGKSAYDWQKKKNAQTFEDFQELFKLLTPEQKARPEVKAIVERHSNAPGSGVRHSFGGKPIIYKIFGDDISEASLAAGKLKVSSLDVFKRTKKGYQDIKMAIKKWAEKGTIVTYDEATEMYSITKIGTLPANE